MDNDKYIDCVLDDKYRILKRIGVGGMAIVYLAVDIDSGEKVAIKMLKEAYATSNNAILRLENELRAISMLHHPNIVRVDSIHTDGEAKYIVMEYLAGITLREYLNHKGALEWEDACEFIEQILDALSQAHYAGVVHRDIKPQNIMVLPGGYVKITDFGIAKVPLSQTLTLADKAIGTVYYISPEQASSGSIDGRSDIYSTGVMFYEMVTGQLPFTADTPIAVVMKHMSDEPERPMNLNPKIPLGLEQIILCAMEKKRENRYQSAAQMLRHIKKLRENPSTVFVRQRPVIKTPTAEVTLKNSRTRQDELDKFFGDLSNIGNTTVIPVQDKKRAGTNAKSPAKKPAPRVKRRGARTDVSFPSVLIILALFMILAGVGIWLLCSMLFKSYGISLSSLINAETLRFIGDMKSLL